MAQATRIAFAALVLCAACVAPAVASRQLKQAAQTINFPGCSFLSDSEAAQNEDFSSLYTVLQATGLNDTLANLTSPHTVFAPTNEAFADFLAAANITVDDVPEETLTSLLVYHVVPSNVQEALDDADVLILPTLLEGANLTVMADAVNSTEVVTIVSDGSEATVVTPAAYACNLVIYGIDGVLIPEEVLMALEPEDQSDALAPESAEAQSTSQPTGSR